MERPLDTEKDETPTRTERRRVLLASYFFPPSRAVGARRPARLARLLPTFGYDVDVICASAENAVEPADPTQWSLVPDTSRVIRVDTPFVFGRNPGQSAPSSLGARVWWKARTYAEWLFVTHDWAWNWGQAAVAALEARSFPPDHFAALVLDAPPGAAVAPIALWARRRGIPTVADLRDAWAYPTENSSRLNLGPRARRIRWLTRRRDEVMLSAARVVFTTPETVELMRRRYPTIPEARFACIPNAFEEERVDHTFDDYDQHSRTLRIVYTGSLAYGRLAQAEALIRGLGALVRANDPDSGDFRLTFAGDEGEALRRVAREESVEHLVEVLGWIERDQAIELQRKSHVLLLLQPPTLGADVAVPAKLFEYMERRKNILGLLGDSPGARIIREHDLGVVARSQEPADIARALRETGERARRQPVLPPPPVEYAERTTVEQFARVLDAVIEGTGDREGTAATTAA